MTATIRKGKINKEEEKKILINCITSTEFLKQASPFLNNRIFAIPYARKIFNWVQAYFEKYEESPSKQIVDIFQVEKRKLQEEEAELISTFLESISNQYIEDEKNHSNVGYQVNSARKYCKQREIELKVSEVNGLIGLDRVDEAESSLMNYKKVAVRTSEWMNPFSQENVESYFESKESNVLFSMPGVLGELLGDSIERGRMISVAAPLKVGKSFLLMEFAMQAILNRKNVVIMNLEMTPASYLSRIYKRISASANKEGETKVAVVDCFKNQNGSCRLKERENKITLFAHADHIPEFEKADPNYKACTACRDRENSDFEPTTWFENIYREELQKKKIKSKSESINKMFGDKLMVRTFPKFTATVEDLFNDIEMLESVHNFVPSVIIVDYPSLLRAENTRQDVRHQIGDIFAELGSLAVKMNCCVIVANQVNREGTKMKMSDATHTGESYFIPQHVDTMISLAQTEQQKKRGIIAVGSSAMRDGNPNSGRVVNMVGDLSTSQICIDSFWAN